jgi:hypothetical protein
LVKLDAGEALAGFDRRTGQDDPFDQVALQRIDGTGDREVGLAGAGDLRDASQWLEQACYMRAVPATRSFALTFA